MHTALGHALLAQSLNLVAQLLTLIVGGRRLIDHLHDIALAQLQLADNALPHGVEVTPLQQHMIDGAPETGVFGHHFAPAFVHHVQLVFQLGDALLDANDLLVVLGLGQFGGLQLADFFL